MRRRVVVTAAVAAVGALLVAGIAAVALRPDLDTIQARVAADYAGVGQIEPDDFSRLGPGRTVVFDVRTDVEYVVSHIAGAVRVEPSASVEDFIALHGSLIDGRTVVFYCSVGKRSSRLAERVGHALVAAGASESYNLAGGLFRWHNEGRALVGPDGAPTRAVHGANPYWAPLIDDGDALRRKPAVATGGD